MNTTYEKFKRYQYYLIIGIISLLAVFFLPMIGSVAGLEWVLPTTPAGWIVFIVSKLIVAIINILIFHCFVLQGKTNIQNNKYFLEAQEILRETVGGKEYAPRSPQQYHASIYGKKGIAIFAASILSAIGLTQAILTFDIITCVTYLFTIVMGIIFGILQMNEVELYWTEEYWRYAKQKQKLCEENDYDRNQWQTTPQPGGTGTTE